MSSYIESVKQRDEQKLRDLFWNDPNGVNQQDEDGKTALMHAVDGGWYPGVSTLVGKASVSVQDNHGRTAVMYAAHHDDVWCVKMLAHGSNVDIHDNHGLHRKNGITYLNCSLLDGTYKPGNLPIDWELEV